MTKRFLLVFALFSAFFLAACGSGGGGGGSGLNIATQDLVLDSSDPADRTAIVNGFSGEPFVFTEGVPEFGTAGTTTTVTITANGTATPDVTITSGGNTATGTMAFGSCIFRITGSNFPPGSPLAANGAFITILNCKWEVRTRGVAANGQTFERVAIWTLNSATGEAIVDVTISPTGDVLINGQPAGNVAVTAATGGGG